MSGDSQKKPAVPAGTQPGEKINFDDYSASYDELLHESTKLYAEDSEYFAKYKVERVRAATTGSVRRILEYGCGTGRNIVHLASAFPGAEVVGSDVSAESLKIAERDNPQSQFMLEDGSTEMGSFDLIFVASVFHHIPPAQRPGVMQKLAARLVPGGMIDVFEHNPFNPVTRRIVDQCPFDADAILLKPRELRELYAQAGLKQQQQTFCVFVPPRLSWLLPIERWLGWLPMGGQYWIRAARAT